MATYKQPCIHCGTFIDRDARFCLNCASRSPFGYQCPTCLSAIQREQFICGQCGRSLVVACPHCGEQTFVDAHCERCRGSLLIPCKNPRCGDMQFFQSTKCTACGKKIKS